MTIVYRVIDEEPNPAGHPDKWDRLLSLRGLGREFYMGLGGATNVIERERETFVHSDPPAEGS